MDRYRASCRWPQPPCRLPPLALPPHIVDGGDSPIILFSFHQEVLLALAARVGAGSVAGKTRLVAGAQALKRQLRVCASKGPVIVIDNYDSFTYNLVQVIATVVPPRPPPLPRTRAPSTVTQPRHDPFP